MTRSRLWLYPPSSSPPLTPPPMLRHLPHARLAPLGCLALSACQLLPSPLTVLHLARHMASVLSPASPLLSFPSSSHAPATKAVDAKLAVGKAREAMFTFIDTLRAEVGRLAERRPAEEKEETVSAASRRKGRRRTVATTPPQNTGASSAEVNGHAVSPSERSVEEERAVAWLPWLEAVYAEMDGGGWSARRSASASKATPVVRRKRSAAVLHSRNRYVDALLQEERETHDSFMDLEDFLVW